MMRCLVGVGALIMIALAACSPSAQLVPGAQPPVSANSVPVPGTPTAAPTVVLPAPDWSRVLDEQLTFADPQQADRTMRELNHWAREASGLRAKLASQADEIFRLAGEVESLAVQDLLRQMQSGDKPKGRPAPLLPPADESVSVNQFAAMTNLMAILSSAPDLVQSRSGGAVKETEQKVGDDATAKIKMQSRVTGSRAELDVDLTLRIEKDGQVYEEKANGKISITVCPDKEGKVPLDLALESRASAGDVGFTTQFADHAIGHVDDDGNLASVERDLAAEISLPRGKNWLTGAVEYWSSKMNLQYTVTGMTSKDAKQWSNTGVTGNVQKSGNENLDNAAISVSGIALYIETDAFRKAEKIWQSGHCIAVTVPEGVEQEVMKWSDTPFTAVVKHKIEGENLDVPVIATLADGMLTVTPSDTKVPAPAAFIYKAPDGAGQEATVELVSRSRRGIAKLNVSFRILDKYYRVDAMVGQPQVPVKGDICALDKPFTLRVDGRNYVGGSYTGTFKFTPADLLHGTWVHEAKSCLPGGKCADQSSSAGYHVEGIAEGRPVIMLHATSGTSAMDGYQQSYAGPAQPLALKLITGACNPD